METVHSGRNRGEIQRRSNSKLAQGPVSVVYIGDITK